MSRVAFTMKLFKGKEAEYKKRHDEIWPELSSLLKQHGIRDYSIFLDEASGTLFGVLDMDDPDLLGKLPAAPVMQKWWSYMKDVMETHPDHSPVSISLKEVFYMP